MFKPSKRIGITASNKLSVQKVTAGTFIQGYGKNSISASAIAGMGIALDTLLQGIIPSETEAMLRRFYRDIYHYDSIGGSFVDLMSNMPFSEFTLIGGSEKELEQHQIAVDRLNLVDLFPQLTRDYLVEGLFLGNMIYDQKSRNFMDIYPYDAASATITPLGFYNLDPEIHITPDEQSRAFLKSDMQAAVRYRSRLPRNLLEAMESSEYVLDSNMTLFLPRKATTRNYSGTSLFRRLLPIYFLEKILWRGTLIEATKRLRSTLHIAAGDDLWTPTAEELEGLVQLFQQAELDPLGAVVSTRQSINLNEIRCVAGDTLVYTEDGPVTIDSLVDHDPDAFTQRTSFDLSIRVRGIDGGFHETTQWHYSGKTKTIVLVTDSGKTLECTPDHKVLCAFLDGCHMIEAQDTLGRLVCTIDRDSADEYKLENVIEIREGSVRHVYDLTMSRNTDPAFVANGIVVHNSGGDFWKITDIYDSTTSMKLRALGVGESFLSSDANYSTTEVNLQVFIEGLKSYRAVTTNKVFYKKIFPMISSLHGLYKDDYRSVNESQSLKHALDSVRTNDNSKLFIPTVRWHKQLEPTGNDDMMETLNALYEKGIPVPVRVWLAAAKIDPQTFLSELEDDIQLQSDLKRVRELYESTGFYRNEEDAFGGGFEFSSLNEPDSTGKQPEINVGAVQELDATLQNMPEKRRDKVVNALITGKDPVGIGARLKDYDELMELKGRTATGKPVPIVNQARAHKAENEAIAKAYNNLSDKNEYAKLYKKLQKMGVNMNIAEEW